MPTSVGHLNVKGRDGELLDDRWAAAAGNAANVPSDIVDLLATFLPNRLKEVAQLRDALQSNDHSMLRRIGERMCGLGTPYGFPEITRLGNRIRAACANPDPAGLKDAIDEYDRYLRKVKIVTVPAPGDLPRWPKIRPPSRSDRKQIPEADQ